MKFDGVIWKCVLVQAVIASAAGALTCPAGFSTNMLDGRTVCLATPSGSLLSQRDAKALCGTLQAYLFTPQSLAEVEIFVSRIRRVWPASYGKSGFWVGYERTKTAPEGTADYVSIRRDKDLFLGRGNVMPYDMWRPAPNEQPGDLTDFRDEICVARKKLPDLSIAGLDDYRCEGGLEHIPICEIDAIYEP